MCDAATTQPHDLIFPWCQAALLAGMNNTIVLAADMTCMLKAQEAGLQSLLYTYVKVGSTAAIWEQRPCLGYQLPVRMLLHAVNLLAGRLLLCNECLTHPSAQPVRPFPYDQTSSKVCKMHSRSPSAIPTRACKACWLASEGCCFLAAAAACHHWSVCCPKRIRLSKVFCLEGPVETGLCCLGSRARHAAGWGPLQAHAGRPTD